mmetsp:Transcript_14112/g.20153  ORF Transcript_14112/g.20153 Transcript_14112/m.20153 type:complete len:413 (+) Transcript_14112:186-1424(+)
MSNRNDIIRQQPNWATKSQAFRHGEKDAIENVLENVDELAKKRMKDGLSEINFTVGVLNVIFIAFTMGAYPQYVWLLYLVEALYFIPMKFVQLIRTNPLNQAFYYFDFCWMMNISGIFILFLHFIKPPFMTDEFRRQIFLAIYGTCCGPLLGATFLLPFVSLMFHDLKSMASVFIHEFPPILMYFFRWNSAVIYETWPGIFDIEDINDSLVFFPKSLSITGTVFGNTLVLYLIWFVFYVAWQLSFGLDLPRNPRRKLLSTGEPAPAKYDTVFHSTYRGGICVLFGRLFFGRSKEDSLQRTENNDFEIQDLMIYMLCHFTAFFLSLISLAYICFLSKYVHMTLLLVATLIICHRGAIRYTYYVTMMYGNTIRKNFADKLNEDTDQYYMLSESAYKSMNYNAFDESSITPNHLL